MTILMLDYYSGNRQPNFAVFGQAGFKAAIRKASMQLSQDIELDIDIPAQKAAGWGVGMYHWCDPIPAPAYWYKQADHFLRAIDKWQPAVLSLDVEQYWASWSDKTQKLAASRILDNAGYLWDYIKARTGLPMMVYTARWFTVGYCPQLGPWIGNKPAWIADYYYYGAGVPSPMHVDAATLAKLIPNIVADPINTPTGVTNIVMRQFESRIWLDGTAHNYDMNVWYDDALFYDWFKLGPPPKTLEQRVTALEAQAHTHGNGLIGSH
jgi:GH25 family lysozyme M1 (1,4-beta-N-acetylmuramidase)